MIHRAILGSLERFIGILIEHYGGKFPLWLNPNQVKVVPVSDKFLDWAQTVTDALAKAGIRADLDSRKENLGRKIRDAQLQQYGYQLVIGGREAESGSVSVRLRSGEDLGAMPLDEFVNRVVTEVANRTL